MRGRLGRTEGGEKARKGLERVLWHPGGLGVISPQRPWVPGKGEEVQKMLIA